jgi:MFS family permease
MSAANVESPVSAIEKSTIKKVAWRLVPFVAFMFFINYLDRSAIGFAAPNGMNDDLALTVTQVGFASGVFFIGYILLEVPSNLALARFGARRWLSRIMVTWGIVAVLFTWVGNFEQLAILRFVLGVAEAGFFPGAILFLSLWVPARHRGKILALFYLAQPLTTVIGAPLAGLLIGADGLFGLEGWRVMFLGVGLPAIVVGVVAWFYLKDKPSDAKWLTKEEQVWLTEELAAEKTRTESLQVVAAGKKRGGFMQAFTSGRVWILAFIYFGFIYGLYTLAFFLPTIINGFQELYGTEYNVFEKGLITAVPYIPAAIALWLWTKDVSKRGLKTWHIAGPAVVGALTIPLALFAGSPVATIAVIALTAMAIFAVLPNFWTLPTQFLTGVAAAAGVALINTVGNLAGFGAPYITGAVADLTKDANGTPQYFVPMAIVGFFLLLSAVLMVVLSHRGKKDGSFNPDATAPAIVH